MTATSTQDAKSPTQDRKEKDLDLASRRRQTKVVAIFLEICQIRKSENLSLLMSDGRQTIIFQKGKQNLTKNLFEYSLGVTFLRGNCCCIRANFKYRKRVPFLKGMD